ncbi:MAG: serine/threonine protein kinase [Polyangiaceae bacterium]|nr:serine/threonine protein kinase [Polyangiaceae bacterium]
MSAGTVIVGRYRLERLLGEGGMGQVWVARHLSLDSLVAVKILAPSAVSNEVLRARFEREARALGQLRSPHVVQIFDYGVDSIGPFMVMELLEGDDLAYLRSQRRYWSLTEVAQIVTHAARGLTAAHKAGVIHRDVKPGNLFLARVEGETVLKVLDFGIAKPLEDTSSEITKTNVGVGSPSYMSPEQTQAQRVDARTDVWGLGVVAFVLLTGELPFQADSPFLIGQKVLRGQRPKPTQLVEGLPRALDAFFDRALAVAPDDRFATPLEMSDALIAISRLYPGAVATDPDVITTERLSVDEARRAVSAKLQRPTTFTIKLSSSDVQPALARAGYGSMPILLRAGPPSQPPPTGDTTDEPAPAPASRPPPPRPSQPAAPTPAPSEPARPKPAIARPRVPQVAELTPSDEADFAPTTRMDARAVELAVEAREAARRVQASLAEVPPSHSPTETLPLPRQRRPDNAFFDVSSGMMPNPYRADLAFSDNSGSLSNPLLRRPGNRRSVVAASIVVGTLVHVALLLGAYWLSTDTPGTTGSAGPALSEEPGRPVPPRLTPSATLTASAPASASAGSSAAPSSRASARPR